MATRYLLLVVLLGTIPIYAEVVDKVVAIINKTSILESELQRQTDQLAEEVGAQVPRNYVRKWALDRLILDTIQMEWVDRYNIEVAEEQQQATIKRMAAQKNLSADAFITQQQKQDPNFLTKVERSIRIELLQQGIVGSRLQKIDDKEVDRYLASNAAQALIAPELVLDIFAITSADESIATDIFQDIKQGKSNIALKKEYGDKLTIAQNQKRSSSDFPSPMSERLAQASSNDVFGPFAVSASTYILLVKKVINFNQGTTKELTHARHILIKVNLLRSSEQARSLASLIKRRLLAGEDFSAIAGKYSEDIATALDGGNLGLADPDQFLPEFRQVLSKLKIGEISEPVHTKFGWHIVQAINRTTVDTKQQLIRAKAKAAIRKQRYQDELGLWLHEIKQQAFVKIIDGE